MKTYKLAKESKIGLAARNQVFYTTHSPYFVDLERFDHIRKAKKVSSPDSPVQQCSVTRFSLEQAKNELARICGVVPERFTRDTFKARAMPIMNAVVNEGFFADVVVVVEGLSEVGTLWKLQEIMKKNWSQLGIAIVPAGGKNNIDRPTVIFKGLSIPTYFIFDGDHQVFGKDKNKEEKTKDINHRCLRLAGVNPEDFPENQVHDTWAVFKETIECVIKEALGEDIFNRLCNKVAMELGYDDPKRVNKNIEGATDFIELIYQEKHRVPILEKIVEHITLLAVNPKK